MYGFYLLRNRVNDKYLEIKVAGAVNKMGKPSEEKSSGEEEDISKVPRSTGDAGRCIEQASKKVYAKKRRLYGNQHSNKLLSVKWTKQLQFHQINFKMCSMSNLMGISRVIG